MPFDHNLKKLYNPTNKKDGTRTTNNPIHDPKQSNPNPSLLHRSHRHLLHLRLLLLPLPRKEKPNRTKPKPIQPIPKPLPNQNLRRNILHSRIHNPPPNPNILLVRNPLNPNPNPSKRPRGKHNPPNRSRPSSISPSNLIRQRRPIKRPRKNATLHTPRNRNNNRRILQHHRPPL